MNDAQERILPLNKLMDIVNMVKKKQKIDQHAQQALMDVAELFIAQTLHESCQLAKHRKSPALEPKDVAFHLEHKHGISLGFSGKTDIRQSGTADHKTRLQLVKNAMDK